MWPQSQGQHSQQHAAVPEGSPVMDPGPAGSSRGGGRRVRLPSIDARVGQVLQLLGSITFIVLYIWSTYSEPAKLSVRGIAELALSVMFLAHWIARVLLSQDRMMEAFGSFWSIADLLSVMPPLVDHLLSLVLQTALPARLDLRWLRMFRALRVLRLGLLYHEFSALHLTSAGALLPGARTVRVLTLVTSILTLLFTTASIVHLMERIPWHDGLYFAVTTLTTVGYGDIIAHTLLGKLVVLGMLVLGAVLIPVQLSQLKAHLAGRRIVLGPLPKRRTRMVLVSSRITEIRGFSDFFSEFYHASDHSSLPQGVRMVCLTAEKPSFEVQAFQEVQERRLSVIEGSAKSELDLQTCCAHQAEACLVLADRFSSDVDNEDVSILFSTWAIKGYTKSVPLYVRVLRRSAMQRVAPFLNPSKDVILSLEQARHRLLALSCICPGASTLLGNLLRTANVDEEGMLEEKAASRRWLRKYINGCAYELFEATHSFHKELQGRAFIDVAALMFRETGVVLVGLVLPGAKVRLNPAQETVTDRHRALAIALNQEAVNAAVGTRWSPAPQLRKLSRPLPVLAGYCSADGGTTDEEMDDDDDYFMCQADAAGTQRLDTIPQMPGAALESDSMDDVGDYAMAEGSIEHEDPQSDSDQDSLHTLPPWEQRQRLRQLGRQAKKRAPAGTRMAPPRPVGLGLQLFRWDDDAGAAAAAAARPELEQQAAASALIDRAAHAAEAAPTAKGGTDVPGSDVSEAVGGSGSSVIHEAMGRGDAAATGEQQDAWPGLQGLRGHTIICGCMSSLAPFVTQLRLCDRSLRPVVVLAPEKPQAQWRQVVASGPALFVKGSPTDAAALKAAKLSTARSIAYLADLARPEQSKGHLSEMGLSAAVLEDAEALLTCYGVGEERSLETTHAVAELTFTSSVRFLQPGLLLKGAYQWEKPQGSGAERAPRRSWMMRRNRERAAVQAGLAEWQANPYYCAGRAVVPAVLDSFTCQCFFNQGRLLDVMRELCGDEGPHTGGCLLRMLPVPEGLEGRTYGELVQQLMLAQRLIPLGLYRRKGENPAWRLQYVYTNPFWHERLEATDYVYVLREWGGVWED